MKPPPFDYRRPTSVDEALEFLGDQDADSKLLAGGQSLVALLRFRLTYFDRLIDIGRLPELRGIHPDEAGGIRIGAMVTQSEAEHDPLVQKRCPVFTEALRLVAHPAIRSCGTIGGSIAHADPAAELPALAIALDATLVSQSVSGNRVHEADEFFTSFFTTALSDEEILTEVRVPALGLGEGCAILESSRRPGDFAIAGVAVRVRLSEGRCALARIVFFGVDQRPVRVREAEEMLIGSTLSDDEVAEAASLATASLDPPSDVRASAEYRLHAARVLCRRATCQARDRARDNHAGVVNGSL